MSRVAEETTCTKCGSIKTRKYGLKILAGGKKAQMFQCKECGSYFRSKSSSTAVEPYHYVRFRWWGGVDLKKVSENLEQSFMVEMNIRPSDKQELALLKDERDELKVCADTLFTMLSRFRAVLYQKNAAPLTATDMKLRKTVLELYPRNRSTPFPWAFSSEPKFETSE